MNRIYISSFSILAPVGGMLSFEFGLDFDKLLSSLSSVKFLGERRY